MKRGKVIGGLLFLAAAMLGMTACGGRADRAAGEKDAPAAGSGQTVSGAVVSGAATDGIETEKENRAQKPGYSRYRCGNSTHFYDIHYENNQAYLVEIDLAGDISQRVKVQDIREGISNLEEILYVDDQAIYLLVFRWDEDDNEFSGFCRIPLRRGEGSDLTRIETLFEQDLNTDDYSLYTFLYTGSDYTVYYDWEKDAPVRYDYDTGKISRVEADFDTEMSMNFGGADEDCFLNYDYLMISEDSGRYMAYDSQAEKLVSFRFGEIESYTPHGGPTFHDLWGYGSRFLYRRKGETEVRCADGRTGEDTVFLTDKQVKGLLKTEVWKRLGREEMTDFTWTVDGLDLREGRLFLQILLEAEGEQYERMIFSCSEEDSSDLTLEESFTKILWKNGRAGRIYAWSSEYLYIYYESREEGGDDVLGYYHLPSGKFTKEEAPLYEGRFYRYMMEPVSPVAE